MEYAQYNNGITYTSLQWKFYHFGPWCNDVYLRIEPALEAVGANKRIVEWKNNGESTKWSVIDDGLYDRLESELPLVITTCIQKFVHRFNTITEDLLDFVYKTFPMLRAKPGDVLDFNIPDYIKKNKEYSNVILNKPDELSVKQKKKKKQAIDVLKKKIKEKLEAKKKEPKLRFSSPLYDDIYFEGLKTLDSLAGEEIKTFSGIVSFSDDIWKSKARFDPDVS